MTGRRREGRVLSGRVAVQVGGLTRPCPKCGAAIGWRCTKTVGPRVLPKAETHPERRDGE